MEINFRKLFEFIILIVLTFCAIETLLSGSTFIEDDVISCLSLIAALSILQYSTIMEIKKIQFIDKEDNKLILHMYIVLILFLIITIPTFVITVSKLEYSTKFVKFCSLLALGLALSNHTTSKLISTILIKNKKYILKSKQGF